MENTRRVHQCIFNTLGAASGFLMKKRSKFAESKPASQPSDSDCHTLSPTIDFSADSSPYTPTVIRWWTTKILDMSLEDAGISDRISSSVFSSLVIFHSPSISCTLKSFSLHD